MNMTYRFFVSREGVPLRLWMLGVNLLSGGHKDEYVMDYFGYKVGVVWVGGWMSGWVFEYMMDYFGCKVYVCGWVGGFLGVRWWVCGWWVR